MLFLMRRRGQKITIGDDITIEIASCGLHKVRIGIDAPKDVPVHRLEIAERIKREERRAGGVAE